MSISILGGGMTKFGELWYSSPRKMAREAFTDALEKTEVKKEQIDCLFVGNMLSGILGNQENLGALFAEELGLSIPAFKVEGACASGALALHNAINAVSSGQYKTAVVLGIEKMTDLEQDSVSGALMAAASDEERTAGGTFVGLYALMANSYMQEYKVTEEDLASIAVKNHYHGSFNPKAQFRTEITIDQVMQSSRISDPLKLLDCSPISDGAAVVIVTADEKLINNAKKPVLVRASEVGVDTLGLQNRKSLVSLSAVVKAAEKAYKKSGVHAKDVDVAEVHDCFTIAEAIAMEDLGFSKRGHGATDIRNGKMTRNKGKIVINPSGGLKACGHPVGATGVKQVIEVVEQLQGIAKERQAVENAKIGLTHNVGGTGAVAVVHIFEVNAKH